MSRKSMMQRSASPPSLKAAVAAAAATVLALQAPPAAAIELDSGSPDVKILWDNTLIYSTAYRLKNPSQAIVGGPNYDAPAATYFPNTDDGSRNFKRGVISNRVDLLSELDITSKNFGARVSAAAWNDSVYLRGNNNDSPGTANPLSVPYTQFTAETRKLHGRDSELLDAFVFARGDVNGMQGSIRFGKHTVLYGESFILGANGIAAAQAPIDVAKVLSVPNSQFKEFMRPVNQISGQLQITPTTMVGAYYMLEWKGDRLPGSGSYFSAMDSIGPGGESLIVANGPPGNIGFARGADLTPKKSGQFGMQAKFHLDDVDLGLYAVQWNDRGPTALYLNPYAAPVPGTGALGLQVGTYQWVYHEGIRAVGSSFTTTVGNVNLAGELSYRTNQPIDSDAQVNVGGVGNGSTNPLYAVGNSMHAQVSWIASLGPSFLSREADFVGEVAFNRLLSVTKNAAAINPNADRDAANVRMIFEPKYRQVMPGLDIGVPVGIGYGFLGNSSVIGPFLGKDTGDISIGINGSYLDVWRFGLNYTHYFGKAGPFIAGGHRSFLQSNADRDFISFNLRRTF